MASIGSLPSTPGTDLSSFLTSAGADAQAQAGVDTSHSLTTLGQNLYGEVNRDAARGSFYSGGAGYRADLLRQGQNWQAASIQRSLSNTMADLARQRIMAAMGINASIA